MWGRSTPVSGTSRATAGSFGTRARRRASSEAGDRVATPVGRTPRRGPPRRSSRPARHQANTHTRHSTGADHDVILAGDGVVAFEAADAALGDRFDLSLIDANTHMSSVQHHVFGTATGRGRLWAVNSGSNTLIRGNTYSNTAAEFQITIGAGAVLSSACTMADFLL